MDLVADVGAPPVRKNPAQDELRLEVPFMRQLTGSDDFWFTVDTPTTPMHIGGVTVYDPSGIPGGKLQFDNVVRHLEARLVATPLREKRLEVPLHLDFPYMVRDDAFDLRNHMRHSTLPSPGGRSQLLARIAAIMAEPLDLSRPLWEMHVIDGIGEVEEVPPGGIVTLLKSHHAQFDGGSTVELQKTLHAPVSVEPGADDGTDEREESPSSAELLARASLEGIARPLRLGRALARIVMPSAAIVARSVRGGSVASIPSGSRFAVPIPSPERVVEVLEFRLPVIGQVRKLVGGATINDVALSLCGGALREYLAHHGELPERSLVGMLPVSARSPGERPRAGNRVSAIFSTLGTDIEDALERLEAITRATARAKEIGNEIGHGNLADLLDVAPSTLAPALYRLGSRLGVTGWVRPPHSGVCLSNVPGSRDPLFWDGARVTGTYGLGFLLDGMGLFHGVTGYCDTMAFSIVSHPELLPDPGFYARCVRTSFERLVECL